VNHFLCVCASADWDHVGCKSWHVIISWVANWEESLAVWIARPTQSQMLTCLKQSRGFPVSKRRMPFDHEPCLQLTVCSKALPYRSVSFEGRYWTSRHSASGNMWSHSEVLFWFTLRRALRIYFMGRIVLYRFILRYCCLVAMLFSQRPSVVEPLNQVWFFQFHKAELRLCFGSEYPSYRSFYFSP